MPLRRDILTTIGCGLFLSASIAAPPEQALTLEQVMAEPDWIGNPVEQAWWSVDGQSVYYRSKAAGSALRDTHRITLADGVDTLLATDAAVTINTRSPVIHPAGGSALFIRHGDVFYRDLMTGQERQLTRTAATERNAEFMLKPGHVTYQQGQQWLIQNLDNGLVQLAAELTFEDEPEDDFGPLAERQLALFSTLQRQADEEQAQEDQADAERAASQTDAEDVWYLGKDNELVNNSLSPDGRWLLVVTREKDYQNGRTGKMPDYVTRSGYVDIEDVRTRVGQETPAPQQLHLLDLQAHEHYALSIDDLPGIADDPLADLRAAQEQDPLEGNRDVSIDGISWHASGTQAAVMIRAIDSKDRWIASVDFERHTLQSQHRLTDPAWINWNFNEFGWLPDAEATLWYVSEESGYAHFYTKAVDSQRSRQHTEGQWEVYNPVVANDGQSVYFMGNRQHPGDYEIYRLNLTDGSVGQLTELDGVERFELSPDQQQVLVTHSRSYMPIQISRLELAGQQTISLTDTRTDAYRAIDWQQPQIVDVPSQHNAGQPIRSKLYLPDFDAYPGPRPVVFFVHGAGYTQNTHQKFPYYFREQMFHNLLNQQGYIVLDMDFRASEGYGRDWRTAIYRQMGHPELEDLLDGVEWLAENYRIDRERVGLYGGSYGGFMTLMAMFRAPESFAAGAALRPVTDWTAYNHYYTANILNTPELDPEAHTKSSPIDYAEGLQGHLLIAHGMLDDNVFYQDSVRLAQRLIELRKDNWELASYPLEPHSFIYADSWYDEYRRIYELFERTIGASE